MFEGFAETRAPGDVRRWAVSAGTSVAVYAAVAGAVLAIVGTGAAAPVARKVQVVFRPPPPPAEEAPLPPPRRRPPPPVTKTTKVIEVEGLPPPAPLVAPSETPLEKPAEAQPGDAPVVVAVAAGSRGGEWGGSVSSAPPASSQPVQHPEGATPPRAPSGRGATGRRPSTVRPSPSTAS